MVTLWGIRLGGYLLYRINKMGKDNRFDEMRESFWKFGRFWLLQGVSVAVVMISSVTFLNTDPQNFGVISIIGILVFLFGLIFEGVADYQKFKFIMNPDNKGQSKVNGNRLLRTV